MKYDKLEEIKNKNYKIVSLGHNCFPRTVLTRWGLKPDKSKGELSMPFDLATFETFEITKNIKTNFDCFFDNLEFKTPKSFFDKNHHWIKAPDCIEFVHEKNLTKNDRNKLIDIYKKRIENFNICIKDTTPILFVQLLGDCEDVENLYDTIKELRGENPFEFVVIDPFKITTTKKQHLHILQTPYPNDKYQAYWWSKAFYKSKEGQNFEKSIVDFCVEKLKLFKPK